MEFHIICPYCGYKLLKADNGSDFEICCLRCKAKMAIKIKDNRIAMERMDDDKELESNKI